MVGMKLELEIRWKYNRNRLREIIKGNTIEIE